MLEKGIKGQEEITVNENNTAEALGSGSLAVFATPAMIALRFQFFMFIPPSFHFDHCDFVRAETRERRHGADDAPTHLRIVRAFADDQRALKLRIDHARNRCFIICASLGQNNRLSFFTCLRTGACLFVCNLGVSLILRLLPSLQRQHDAHASRAVDLQKHFGKA